MAGVHASIQGMEAKMEEALTEQTSTLAAAIDRIATSVANTQPSFAQAAKSTRQPAPPKSQKPPKPTQPPLPPSPPEFLLPQVVRGDKAEMNTDAETLAARVNTAIQAVIPIEPPIIRAFKRVHQTGDIAMLFDSQEQVD